MRLLPTTRSGISVNGEPLETTIAAAQDGAEWAWRRLYDELAGPVRGYLRVRGAEEVDDLVGEVFVQLARNIRSFSGDGPAFRSWVFVIAHHRLVDERRKRRRRPTAVASQAVLEGLVAADDPAAEALAHVATERVLRLFGLLTPQQREVLALRIVAGLSLEQTALIVGKRVNAVKALQRRGLEAIRRAHGDRPRDEA